MPGESRYWTPSILLEDWERSQLQVRQTRSEKEWLASQAKAWKQTAQQALTELEQCRLEVKLMQSQLQQAQTTLERLRSPLQSLSELEHR